MGDKLVRIKPRDTKHGLVLRQYSYRGINFKVNHGWYRVSEDVAEYLEDVRQSAGDSASPKAFDVCTEKEAMALDEKEAEYAKEKRPVDNARKAKARGETQSPKSQIKKSKSKSRRSKDKDKVSSGTEDDEKAESNPEKKHTGTNSENDNSKES